jgi:hypothetical protein
MGLPAVFVIKWGGVCHLGSLSARLNGTQLSQEASDKTLFVASARMYTKAPGRVCRELGATSGLRQVTAVPKPWWQIVWTQSASMEMAVRGSWCGVAAKHSELRRESVADVQGVEGLCSKPCKPCSHRPLGQPAWTCWKVLNPPPCWRGCISHHSSSFVLPFQRRQGRPCVLCFLWRKLRLREVQRLARGFTASKQQIWYLSFDFLTSWNYQITLAMQQAGQEGFSTHFPTDSAEQHRIHRYDRMGQVRRLRVRG